MLNYERPYVLSSRHSFDQKFMKLGQNVSFHKI